MKLLISHHHHFALWCAPAWLGPRLAADFPEIRVVQLTTDEQVLPEIADSEIFIGAFITPEEFQAGRKLKWIHSPAAAVHQFMFPGVVGSKVIVTNSGEVHGPVVAEHALAVMLALAKRLPQAIHYQQRKKWAQNDLWQQQPRPREISGGIVVVIGMGSIGREFTVRAKALGMRVLAVRENPEKGTAGADAVCGPGELDSVLSQADYVLLCTPVTPSTTGLMNQSRLGLMKSDAYLINVGRGSLVEETDLLDALRTGKIAGAALDVFSQEPLPSASPFWNLENVLITPHTAAVTDNVWQRHCELISENLRRFLQGRELLNLIDKGRGY